MLILKTKNYLIQHYKIISSLILLSSIIPFVLLSFYSRPCADDYDYSILMHKLVQSGNANVFTVFRTALLTDIEFYNSWQGLYVAAFLQSLQPGSFGEKYYFIGALFFMIIIFATSHYFIKTLFKIFKIDSTPLFSTIILFSIFMHGMLSTTEGLYWFCGAADYIPFLMLNMINICFVLEYTYNDKKIYLLLSTICSFLLSGGNHVNSFLNILILTVIMIICIIKKKHYGITISLLSSLIGFVIMLVAPGTKVRMDVFMHKGVMQTISATFIQSIKLMFSKPYFNIRFLLYLSLVSILASHNIDNKMIKEIDIHPVVLFLTFAMFLCGMLAVPYYAMGKFGADRLKNVVWMSYMMFAGIFCFYTIIWLSKKHTLFYDLMDNLRSLQHGLYVIVVCLLFIVSSGNVFSIIQELTDGTAKTFAEQYNQRYAIMEKCDNTRIIVFENIIDSPNLKFDDITPDINNWKNKSWNEYYGVKAVTKSKK